MAEPRPILLIETLKERNIDISAETYVECNHEIKCFPCHLPHHIKWNQSLSFCEGIRYIIKVSTFEIKKYFQDQNETYQEVSNDILDEYLHGQFICNFIPLKCKLWIGDINDTTTSYFPFNSFHIYEIKDNYFWFKIMDENQPPPPPQIIQENNNNLNLSISFNDKTIHIPTHLNLQIKKPNPKIIQSINWNYENELQRIVHRNGLGLDISHFINSLNYIALIITNQKSIYFHPLFYTVININLNEIDNSQNMIYEYFEKECGISGDRLFYIKNSTTKFIFIISGYDSLPSNKKVNLTQCNQFQNWTGSKFIYLLDRHVNRRKNFEQMFISQKGQYHNCTILKDEDYIYPNETNEIKENESKENL